MYKKKFSYTLKSLKILLLLQLQLLYICGIEKLIQQLNNENYIEKLHAKTYEAL